MPLPIPRFASTRLVGAQPITETSTIQNHPLGTRTTARDPVYGEAEFIYLAGVAATVAGDAVAYSANGFTTARAAARTRGPVAIAMSPCVANQFGWYAINGQVPVTAAASAVGATAYFTATAGSVSNTVVAGDILYGAVLSSLVDTGQARVTLATPAGVDSDNA